MSDLFKCVVSQTKSFDRVMYDFTYKLSKKNKYTRKSKENK